MAHVEGSLVKLRDVASDNFNRWLIPVAALCVHLSIGQIYSFSVFNNPLSRLIGIVASRPQDWSVEMMGWVFSIAIAALGLTAAFAGPTLEKWGPRKTLRLCALFFAGGFWLGALGIYLHQFWLLCVGYGLIGGIGLGLGYATPVAVLMRWFPDRPGMAAGMAIMGFGGGAMIGAPLAVELMRVFASPSGTGVWQTFVVMGALYFVAIHVGAWLIRNPSPAFLKRHEKLAAKNAKVKAKPMADVSLTDVMRGRNFYLLWGLFGLNILAGLGVISSAASMIKEIFPDQATVGIATLFVALISVGNMVGRLGWATVSDYLGRKVTFGTFFVLGAVLYALLALVGVQNMWVYMVVNIVLISMYGGGFSTMPVYLKDCYGMANLTPIYGRILTAWSAGAVLGHMLISALNEWQMAAGATRVEAYSHTMLVMSGLMVVAFGLNVMVQHRMVGLRGRLS